MGVWAGGISDVDLLGRHTDACTDTYTRDESWINSPGCQVEHNVGDRHGTKFPPRYVKGDKKHTCLFAPTTLRQKGHGVRSLAVSQVLPQALPRRAIASQPNRQPLPRHGLTSCRAAGLGLQGTDMRRFSFLLLLCLLAGLRAFVSDSLSITLLYHLHLTGRFSRTH